MKKPTFVVFALAALFFELAGCVTREDIRGVQTGIYNIEKRLDTKIGTVKAETENVQVNQADLAQEIKDLNQNIAALQADLKEERDRNRKYAERMDDLEASLTARLDSQTELLSGSKFAGQPVPSTIFNLADADFARGRLPQAIQGFQNYLSQYPKAERAPEAKLKIADAHAKLKDWNKSIDAYDTLIKENPDDALIPTALLRKGRVLEEMGNQTGAKAIYQKIIQSYQYKPEASLAQERLNNLQSPSEK